MFPSYRYHPYKAVRRQKFENGDHQRRLNFCHWITSLTQLQLLSFLFSDEAYFELDGSVNSKNVVRYAPLKSSDPNGGRPEHFVVEKPTFSSKLMVFCGIRRDGTFGFKVYKNGESMDTNRYHSLLTHHVMPELRNWNGGNLDG